MKRKLSGVLHKPWTHEKRVVLVYKPETHEKKVVLVYKPETHEKRGVLVYKPEANQKKAVQCICLMPMKRLLFGGYTPRPS